MVRPDQKELWKKLDGFESHHFADRSALFCRPLADRSALFADRLQTGLHFLQTACRPLADLHADRLQTCRPLAVVDPCSLHRDITLHPTLTADCLRLSRLQRTRLLAGASASGEALLQTEKYRRKDDRGRSLRPRPPRRDLSRARHTTYNLPVHQAAEFEHGYIRVGTLAASSSTSPGGGPTAVAPAKPATRGARRTRAGSGTGPTRGPHARPVRNGDRRRPRRSELPPPRKGG